MSPLTCMHASMDDLPTLLAPLTQHSMDTSRGINPTMCLAHLLALLARMHGE